MRPVAMGPGRMLVDGDPVSGRLALLVPVMQRSRQRAPRRMRPAPAWGLIAATRQDRDDPSETACPAYLEGMRGQIQHGDCIGFESDAECIRIELRKSGRGAARRHWRRGCRSHRMRSRARTGRFADIARDRRHGNTVTRQRLRRFRQSLCVRPLITSAAPRSASASAQARPSPPEAPVIRAVRPAISGLMGFVPVRAIRKWPERHRTGPGPLREFVAGSVYGRA